ncbi:carboxypeptidase B-like [Cloeon dipterum]|uniref:carboxypeptidase B-like n=1 Tax=Cloeon dipterum TaxID=197152 RepID=UPI00321F7A06
MKIGACFLLALLGCANGYKNYSGFQLLQTKVLTNKDVDSISPLIDFAELDFWIQPRVGRSAEILIAPEHAAYFKGLLNSLGLEPRVIVDDISVHVERERNEIEHLRLLEKRGGRAPALDRFLNFEEIMAYVDEVSAAFPEIVTVIEIGSSWEGRPLKVVKLSNGPGKNGIFFDSAIHAREWIGPPTALFAINELTENLANNQALLDANDWYFLLIANPDGYHHSWVQDRFWRKTRRPNNLCVGTDPNRNFDQHWAEGANLTEWECSATYPGSEPFSEPECKAISDFILTTPSITMYVAIHSYGKYILYPWGHTNDLPPNVNELDAVAQEANAAITAVNGTVYEIGTTANVLYHAFGTSNDWAYEQAGISLAYTIELPGGGLGGFNPPASDISLVNDECWEAYKVFAANIPLSRKNF